MNAKSLEKIKHLLHLHTCEQEGMSSGQPTAREWIKAVDDANEAIIELESPKLEPGGAEHLENLREQMQQEIDSWDDLSGATFDVLLKQYAEAYARSSQPPDKGMSEGYCQDCNGSGRGVIPDSDCEKCGGSGETPEPRELPTDNVLAKWMHDQYEEIAKQYGWDTQKSTKVEFNDLPDSNKSTMHELARRIKNKWLKDNPMQQGGEGWISVENEPMPRDKPLWVVAALSAAQNKVWLWKLRFKDDKVPTPPNTKKVKEKE